MVAAAAMAILAAAAGGAAQAADQDEIVPGGNLLLRATVVHEIQREAIAVDGQRRPLVDYLVHKPGVSKDLSGDVMRYVTATETQVTYGISDTWNLQLSLPYLIVRQDSSLEASGGGASALFAEEQLKSETVSGIGTVRLMSLHRPLFSDTDAIVLGWGWMFPGGPQETDYIGRGTLSTRVPYQSAAGVFHYTVFPLRVDRARFDLRFELNLAFAATVDTPGEKGVTLQGANRGSMLASWAQEFEGWGFEVAYEYIATTPTFIGIINQQDITIENRLSVEWLRGNLHELEKQPIEWPYQLGVRLDHLLFGFNVPYTTRLGFFAKLYF